MRWQFDWLVHVSYVGINLKFLLPRRRVVLNPFIFALVAPLLATIVVLRDISLHSIDCLPLLDHLVKVFLGVFFLFLGNRLLRLLCGYLSLKPPFRYRVNRDGIFNRRVLLNHRVLLFTLVFLGSR